MKKSKYLTPVQTNDPLCFMLIENENGTVMAQYRISPYGSLMDNAELTSDIMEAYERYYKALLKNR